MSEAVATHEPVAKPVNTARSIYSPIPDAKQAGNHYIPLPDGTKDGWTHAHARQTILVEPEALYQLWSKTAEFPRWQEHVVSVTPIGDRRTHWVMGNPEDPKGKRIEFDSEITEDLPGRRIAWQTIGGDVEQSGSVDFESRSDGRGTLVTLIQHFKMGALANAAASIAKRGPKQTVIEDLRHFKELAEAGELPTVKGQPHGPRGFGGLQEFLLGETNPTPPGTSDLA